MGSDEQQKELLGSEKEAAAISIQKNIREFLARRKFHLTHLNNASLMDYEAFLIGNDPVIEGLRGPSEGSCVLIATSGIRAVALACKLSERGKQDVIPKIILVDNSRQVYEFWQAIRKFAEKNNQEQDFLAHLPIFLTDHNHLFKIFKSPSVRSIKYPKQNIQTFFFDLFRDYGYEKVRRMIMHTSFVRQSFEDDNTFIKLQNILRYLKVENIYVYASNIISSYDYEKARTRIEHILINIYRLNPKLVIYTDLCKYHLRPENVYLTENQKPDWIKQKLFPLGQPSSCRSPASLRYKLFGRSIASKYDMSSVISSEVSSSCLPRRKPEGK